MDQRHQPRLGDHRIHPRQPWVGRVEALHLEVHLEAAQAALDSPANIRFDVRIFGVKGAHADGLRMRFGIRERVVVQPGGHARLVGVAERRPPACARREHGIALRFARSVFDRPVMPIEERPDLLEDVLGKNVRVDVDDLLRAHADSTRCRKVST